ncbi:hypothetical protein KVP10_19485, partial [Candidimonas humi]|nr:hypothetical protein [Candidimonas humi]
MAITDANLKLSDPDDANSGAGYENPPFVDGDYAVNNGTNGTHPLEFVITDLPDHGTLQYWSGTAWVDITADDLYTGGSVGSGVLRLDASILVGGDGLTKGLRYVNDGGEVNSDSFQVRALDNRDTLSDSAATVNIVITPVNDAPQIAHLPTDSDPTPGVDAPNHIGGDAANDPVTVREGGAVQITSDYLQAYDPDSTAEQVQYTITQAPQDGYIAISTDGGHTFQELGKGASFSQADIAAGRVYYVHNGDDPTSGSSQDKFFFTLADGDKEVKENEFWINVASANDAPTVTAPSGPVIIDSSIPADNPVKDSSGHTFTVGDVDVDSGSSPDAVMQVTIRLLDQDGKPLSSKAAYSGVTIGYAGIDGINIWADATHNGSGDFLVLNGTKAQINAALAGLTLTFASDQDNNYEDKIYQVQVIADDRVRNPGGALIDGDPDAGGVQPEANGGTVNQATTVGGDPTAVPGTVHNWYTDSVASDDPNIAAKAVVVWASSVNDMPTVTLRAAPTDIYEDTAYEFSAAKSNAVSIADSESSAFGKAVQVTLQVSNGTLTFGSAESGVTISGSGTGTVVLTGSADRIQAQLNDGFSYKGKADFNGADTLKVTVNEYQAAIGGDVGSGSVVNPDVFESVALNLIPVNDAPTVATPSGPIDVGTNTVIDISGVSVGDGHDMGADGSGVQSGEHDFVQVTVRLLDASGNPVTDYSGIVLQVGDTAGASPVAGVTIDSYNGEGTPLVLRGILEDVNSALAQLKISVTGDRNVTYQLQVLADDRMRAQDTGALVDANGDGDGSPAYANGGGVNQQTGLPAVPTDDAFFDDPIHTTTATATSLYDIVASTVALHVSSTNDAPTIGDLSSGLTLAEDASATPVKLADGSYISIGDTDDFGSNFTVTLTAHYGTLSGLSAAGLVSLTDTGADGITVYTLVGTKGAINTALQSLQFKPAADLNGPSGIASIDISVTDTALPGSSGGDLTTTRTLEIAINPVNDQPTISNDVTLPAYTEDVTDPAGTRISDLDFGYSDATDRQSGTSNDDVQGYDNSTPFTYIAIVGATNYTDDQGNWEISSDGGAHWIVLSADTINALNAGGSNSGKALVFSSGDLIRFVPSANFFGTPGSLTILAGDGSDTDADHIAVSTSAGDAKTLVTGETNRWSSATETISTTVTNVNDRPTGTDASITQNEGEGESDSDIVYKVSDLDFGYSDARDNQSGITGGGNEASVIGGIAIVGNTADSATEGTWQYSTDSGGTWKNIDGTVSNSSALLLSNSALLRFIPVDADYNGVPTGLSVRLSDVAVDNGSGVDIRVDAHDVGVDDASSHWSEVVQLKTSVVKQNDAPVLIGTAADPTAPENDTTGSDVSVDGVRLFNNDISLSDIDLSTTAGLGGSGADKVFGAGTIHVQITSGKDSGDVLYVDPDVLPDLSMDASNVSAGTDGTLTITLSKSTTLADVKTLIEAIYYKSTSDNPTANNTNATRDYKVWVSDGKNLQVEGGTNIDAGGPGSMDSAAITGTLRITPVNDKPVVDLNGSGTGRDSSYTWVEPSNAPDVAKAFMPGATLSDVDNANLTQMQLVVGGAVDTGYEDLIVGGVTFDLSADKTASAGGFDITYTAATHTFDITPTSGIATVASFQSLLRGVEYNNRTDKPTAGDRTVTVKVTDAGLDDAASNGVGDNQLDSNVATAIVTVQPSNDQPVISGLDPVTYHENDINAAPAVIDADIALTDIDSENFDHGELKVTGLAADDQVGILSDSTVRLSGSTVQYYDGSEWVDVGIYSSTAGAGGSLTISLNSNVTPEIAQSLVEHLTFANSSDVPVTSRTLSISVTDGNSSGNAQVATVVVGITPDNDAPSIDGLDGVSEHATATDKYLQGGDPVVIDGNVSLVDPELGARDDWSGATLTISRQGGASSDDLFGSLYLVGGNVTVGGETIGTYTDTGGTLEITFASGATTVL